ncbi:MAG: hypothetical protein ABW170_21360 [Candidatus Thiodiazotropha sp. L084R]
MLALYPLWRKARRVYSLTSRLPGTNRLGFQPSLALSEGVCALMRIRCRSHDRIVNQVYRHQISIIGAISN